MINIVFISDLRTQLLVIFMDMCIVTSFMFSVLMKKIRHVHSGELISCLLSNAIFVWNDLMLLYRVGYLAPSVTSYGFHAAGYRLYEIDGTYNGSSRVVLDHSTYIMNITDANLSNKPKWELEYTAKVSANMFFFRKCKILFTLGSIQHDCSIT